MYFLTVVSGVHLFYRLLVVFVPPLRYYLLDWAFYIPYKEILKNGLMKGNFTVGHSIDRTFHRLSFY